MNQDQLEAAKAQLQAIRSTVREDLAADLGGDPEDYRAERYFQESGSEDSVVSDGGR